MVSLLLTFILIFLFISVTLFSSILYQLLLYLYTLREKREKRDNSYTLTTNHCFIFYLFTPTLAHYICFISYFFTPLLAPNMAPH